MEVEVPPMTAPPDTDACFEAAVQVENLMRDLYLRLSAIAGTDVWARELFQRLAEEEEQHAHRIRLLARHQGRGPWAQETAARITTELSAMTAELTRLVEELGAGGGSPGRAEVLRRVIDAEHRASVLHAEVLARSAEIDVQMLFHSLAKQDVHHKQLLEKVAEPDAARVD